MPDVEETKPTEVGAYISNATRISVELCGDSLVSILVFGSVAHGDFNPNVSDVDLLFVLKDDFPNSRMKHLVEELDKAGAATSASGTAGKTNLFVSLASKSVFFKPYFVFHQSTLAKPTFSSLMEEGQAFDFVWRTLLEPIASVLTPWRLVLFNVLKHSRAVYGTRISREWPEPNWRVERTRSFVFSFIVSLLGGVTSFVSRDGTLLSLEALKWYLINDVTCELRRPASLKDALPLFFHSHPRTTRQLIDYRTTYRPSVKFSLACPILLTWMVLTNGH